MLTVGIPTCNRPILLKNCLESLLSSGLEPSQVIIGDDFPNPETESVISDFKKILPILHIKNTSGIKSPVINYYSIIKHASGDWLCIIHDDDFFVGSSVKIKTIFPYNDFIFTDHWVASSNGDLLKEQTEKYTKLYGRDKLIEGVQTDPLSLFLGKSICWDGFFVKTEIAKSIPYDIKHKFTAGELLLLARIIQRCKSAYYSKDRIFAYRLTGDSITSRGWDNSEIYESYCELEVKEDKHIVLLESLKKEVLPRAVSDYLRRGEYLLARRLFFSKNYPFPKTINMYLRMTLQFILFILPFKIVRIFVLRLKKI